VTFVLHAGLAFGAFHRWIYKPFKAGARSPVRLEKLVAPITALAGQDQVDWLEHQEREAGRMVAVIGER